METTLSKQDAKMYQMIQKQQTASTHQRNTRFLNSVGSGMFIPDSVAFPVADLDMGRLENLTRVKVLKTSGVLFYTKWLATTTMSKMSTIPSLFVSATGFQL